MRIEIGQIEADDTPAVGPTPLALALMLAIGGTATADDAAWTSPEACAACHAEEHATWSGSRHAQAASNPVFRASWEHWPNGWCLSCHAPREAQQVEVLGRPAVAGVLRSPLDTPLGDTWRDGVDCAACHLDGDVLRSSRPPSALAADVHPIREDPALYTEALCATCHEFPMQVHTPRWPFVYGDTPAQATISEWRSSTAYAEGRRCQGCHMGEHAHGFPGAHTPDLVRGALTVRVTSVGAGEYEAVVSAPGAAHRVPTGDPFRRLTLSLCADPECASVLATRALTRLFATTDTTWVEIDDRTVPPERPGAPAERVLTLRADAPASFWRLDYAYGDRRFEAALPPEEVGFVVATGEVRAATGAPAR